MRRRKLALGLLAVAVVPSSIVFARSIAHRHHGSFGHSAPTFELGGRPIGGVKPAAPTAPYLTGSRISALDQGALVIDADSGSLLKTDAAGKLVAQLAIGRDAGLMTYDPVAKLAYVADRHGDKVVVVKVGDKLEVARTFKTPTEPYGIALTPDRQTLLVSTIADRTLVAYDAAKGGERWRTGLAREPRGLAISPDGTRALVAYLTTGTVDQVDLVETHRAEHIAIATASARRFRSTNEGNAFARAAFAVTFMGPNQAVVPFQREVPVQITGGAERSGSYGGGFEPPVQQQLAFVGFQRETPTQVTAQIAQNQPRALAWDSARDTLYVAGVGTDTVLQIKKASQIGISQGAVSAASNGTDRCGPDGLAVAPDGDLLVWCSFSRTVNRLDTVDDKGELTSHGALKAGTALVASRYSKLQHTGMVLFHTASTTVSQGGSMACSTCHPDNRADGLSWRIEKAELQTPVLAGRITNTHPYKWDGGDKDLTTSLTMTMKRLGGSGLAKDDVSALGAYLESLPSPRPPRRNPVAVARGKQLFDSAELGCRTCHDGATYTDNSMHKLSGTLAQSDTPSLLGLAASAPYFHDGSAATLEALLRERGAVHGMAETTKLDDKQVADLTAFLESL